MRITPPIKPSLAILLCLLSCGCDTSPGMDQVQPGDDMMVDVVPYIEYPDIYAAALGFGFDLPAGWNGQWDQGGQIFRFTQGNYILSLRYDTPDPDLLPLMHRIGQPAGRIWIEGFWGSTWMCKYRLVSPTGVILVTYFAESSLQNRWLRATLEAEMESSSPSIPLDVEHDADRILASYEEHGWEE